MFNNTFYPTPETIANKMLEGIDFTFIQTVLEPSAGKGDLIAAVQKANDRAKHSYNYSSIDIDAVEIDPNLRALLKGNEIRVVHDNFLTMHTSKHYDLIVMNPPFNEGDKHLLKALEMQQNGGQGCLPAQCRDNPKSIFQYQKRSGAQAQRIRRQHRICAERFPGRRKKNRCGGCHCQGQDSSKETGIQNPARPAQGECYPRG